MRALHRIPGFVLVALAWRGDQPAQAADSRTPLPLSAEAAAADTALDSLPLEAFLQLGVTTHTGFDSLAVAAGAKVPTDSVLARLSRITSNCVACHAQYRIVVN